MARIVEYAVEERDVGTSRTGVDTIRESHVVITDVRVSKEWIVRHRDTPIKNAAAARHPGFFWDDVEYKQTAPLVWEIDATATPFQLPEFASSPLARPATITIDSELVNEPTLFDYKNRPTVTTAGEWIDGITRDRPRLVYRVTKNLPADPVWLDNYPGAISADAVRLRGRVRKKNTLMLRRVRLGEYTKENNVWFTRCEFELHFDPLGWIHHIWNRGTLKLVQFTSAAGKKAWRQERIKIGTPPQDVEQPVLLDKNGQPVPGVLDPKGETPIDVSKTVVLDINTQPLLPFNSVLPLQ